MDGLYDQGRIALHSIWQRRWLALAVAWGLCLLGWGILALIPNSFEARARLFIQPQQLLANSLQSTPSNSQGDLFRVRQAMLSNRALETVVRRTELATLVTSDADLAAQVNALRLRIKVAATPENLIEVTATASQPQFSNAQNARLAGQTVQTLLDALIETNSADDSAANGQTLALIDEQLKSRETALQQAEQRRVEFEQKFLGALPGQGSLADRMSAARAELSSLDQQLIVSQGTLQSLRGQLAGTPATVAMPGYGPGPATSQLNALEAQLAQGQARGWTTNHPDMVATRAEIARLRPMANAERGGGGGGTANPAYASMRAMVAEKEAQVSAAMSRKSQLLAGMNELDSRQSAEPGVVSEQARLNRDYEVLKRQYDKLLEDREQIRLRSDVESKTDALQFRIVEPPSQPTAPASPNRPLLLSAILFLALAGGIGAAFAMGQLQTTFPTQARLAAVTGLPVIGTIGDVETQARRARRQRRLRYFAGAGGALAAAYALLMAVEFWQRAGLA